MSFLVSLSKAAAKDAERTEAAELQAKEDESLLLAEDPVDYSEVMEDEDEEDEDARSWKR